MKIITHKIRDYFVLTTSENYQNEFHFTNCILERYYRLRKSDI